MPGTSSGNPRHSRVREVESVLWSSAPFLHVRKLRQDGSGPEAVPAERECRVEPGVWFHTLKFNFTVPPLAGLIRGKRLASAWRRGASGTGWVPGGIQ